MTLLIAGLLIAIAFSAVVMVGGWQLFLPLISIPIRDPRPLREDRKEVKELERLLRPSAKIYRPDFRAQRRA